MMTKRVPAWQAALADAVAAHMHRPFAWGAQDCCLFAADMIQAITGEDPALDVRGTYYTVMGAAAVLRDLGGVAHIAETRFGAEVPVTMAQTGDVALVRFDGRDTLAVCVGGHLFAPGADGLVYVPLGEALRVWRCTRDK